jgi:hypothetical protein
MRRGRGKLGPKVGVEVVAAAGVVMAAVVGVDMAAEVEAEATAVATEVHARPAKLHQFFTAPLALFVLITNSTG